MVSVIIPNYNHAPFLVKRIDSVLKQSFQDFEIIILDDCSTDNSKDIIETYRSHPKVKHIVYNQKNSGSAFKQWQKGLELAAGEYIWIAESDDYAAHTFLITMMQAFSSEHKLILSYCQSMLVDEHGNMPYGVSDWADPLNENKWKRDYVESTLVEVHDYLTFRNTIVNASAAVFKKPADINILNQSSNMKMLGDWLFWRKLLSEDGKVAFFSSPLNYFRFHNQSTRAPTTKEKELARMKEYKCLIIPEMVRISDTRYDWMIFEWYRNRKVLKGSLYYFIPNLPHKLVFRFFKIIVSSFRRKIFAVR